MTAPKLLRLVEIASILGVSKQRADQLRHRPDFPASVGRWARGDLWAASDVRRWARIYSGGALRWDPRDGPSVPRRLARASRTPDLGRDDLVAVVGVEVVPPGTAADYVAALTVLGVQAGVIPGSAADHVEPVKVQDATLFYLCAIHPWMQGSIIVR